MKWWTNTDSHTSYIATVCSSLHQKLAFPYVWVSAKYGTDVPAPPQLSLLPGGVTVRLCHKQMMVWQSPSIRLGRLPWGGSMGSYGFSHGHQPEHPLRMGEDFMQCVVGMDVYQITCIWWRGRHLSPQMPSDSRLNNDCHDYSWNWVMVARPLAAMKWICIPLCQDFWWFVIIYLDAEHSHSIVEGPLLPLT